MDNTSVDITCVDIAAVGISNVNTTTVDIADVNIVVMDILHVVYFPPFVAAFKAYCSCGYDIQFGPYVYNIVFANIAGSHFTVVDIDVHIADENKALVDIVAAYILTVNI